MIVGISLFMMGHQHWLIYTLLVPFNWVFVIFNIVQALLWIGSTLLKMYIVGLNIKLCSYLLFYIFNIFCASRLICNYQPSLFPLLYFLFVLFFVFVFVVVCFVCLFVCLFHTVPVGLSVIYIIIHLALEFLHWLQHIHTSQWGPLNSCYHFSPAPILLF